MHATPNDSPRRRRLLRVEDAIDRWLTLYEAALAQAEECAPATPPPKLPDLLKTTELANLFRACRVVLDLDLVDHKLAEMERARDGHETLRFDPDLLGGGVPGDPGED
jgi:hypothetical protein